VKNREDKWPDLEISAVRTTLRLSTTDSTIGWSSSLRVYCNFSPHEELPFHKAEQFVNGCLALPVDRDYRGCLTARSRLEHPNRISFAKNRPSIKHLSIIGDEERGIGMISGQTSKSASAQSLEHLQPSSTIVPFTPID
jgi:hypothetical protein